MTIAPKRVVFLCAFLVTGWTGNSQALSPFSPPQANDRIVIIAPHPDDEVLGAGGLIQQAVAVGAKIRVVYMTNGEHNQATFQRFSQRLHQSTPDCLGLGEQRRREALAAAKLLGLNPGDLTFLGYPDWCTMHLWQDWWGLSEGYFYGTTHSNRVPYSEDFGYQHPYRPENLTADLCAVLRTFRPTRVFVTHPCDTNPDHRAAANFVQLALLELEPEGVRPTLDFYLVHFGNWPNPLQYHPDAKLSPPTPLLDGCNWMSLPLTLPQVKREDEAMLTEQTQIANHQDFLESFARANEVFAAVSLPAVPVLPPDALVNAARALSLPVLPVLPSDYGYEANGIASLSASGTLLDPGNITIFRQDDELVTQVRLPDLADKRVGVELHAFGYKRGADFASLPKVQINISPRGRLSVLVNHQVVESCGVHLSNVGRRMTLRVPLALLGGSGIDHLFTSVFATLDGIAAADTAWHLLRLQPPARN